MNGQEFYKLFRYEFDPNHNTDVKDAYTSDKKLTRQQWTYLMDKVLKAVMTKAGFDPSIHMQEVPVRKGKCIGRVDHKWQKQNETVFIEDENDIHSNINSEIENLLNSDGDLRVLITYSSNSSRRETLRKSLYQQLKVNKSSRKFEFLLIIGRDNDMNFYNDWEAFHYIPSFEEVPLPVSS